MTKFCHYCGTQIIDEQSNFCKKCGTVLQQVSIQKINIENNHMESLNQKNLNFKNSDLNKIPTTLIQETRCTCTACGKVWYYGKKEISKNTQKKIRNFGKDVSGCSCCWPMWYLHREETDLDKCPNCSSKTIKKEQVTHEVE